MSEEAGEEDCGESVANRVKIWMGKRKVGDSDNDDVDEDDSDDDEEEENDKSVILDNGNGLDSNKEAEGSLGSITGWNRDGESSGGVCAEIGTEGAETAIRGSSFAVESSDAGMVGSESNDAGEPALGTLGERMVRNGGVSLSEEELFLKLKLLKLRSKNLVDLSLVLWREQLINLISLASEMMELWNVERLMQMLALIRNPN